MHSSSESSRAQAWNIFPVTITDIWLGIAQTRCTEEEMRELSSEKKSVHKLHFIYLVIQRHTAAVEVQPATKAPALYAHCMPELPVARNSATHLRTTLKLLKMCAHST